MALQQYFSSALSWLQHIREQHPKRSAFAAVVLLYILYKRLNTRRKKSVDNKVVLITGGASGIGKNMAKRFSALGARVVLWDINEKALAAVGKQIAAEGGMCWTYVCDVTDRVGVYRVAERVHREVGKVDILINNAGIVSGDFITDVPDSKIELTFKVNVISHFWIIKAFLPEMIRFNSGHIVTVASAAGLRGGPKLTDYCASKGAAVLLDESLRVELSRRNLTGVKTTCVCPFYINTGMFDGAKTRFPLLLPILSEDYASSRIVKAILTDEPFLQMPWLVSTMPLLRFLLPVRACDWVSEFLGVSTSMDEFVGRGHGSSSAANPQ